MWTQTAGQDMNEKGGGGGAGTGQSSGTDEASTQRVTLEDQRVASILRWPSYPGRRPLTAWLWPIMTEE